MGLCFALAFTAPQAGLASDRLSPENALNDYPTEARAEYVFACMKVNGETRDILERCSCSIDVIASLIPYAAYVAAETVASMDQAGGQIGGMFRESALTREDLATLRRAEAEANVRCF